MTNEEIRLECLGIAVRFGSARAIISAEELTSIYYNIVQSVRADQRGLMAECVKLAVKYGSARTANRPEEVAMKYFNIVTYQQPDDTPNLSMEFIQWLANGERGGSSNQIASVLSGVDCCPGGFDGHPYDIDGFRRCEELLKAVPELKTRLHEMSNVSTVWKSFVDNWDDISEMRKNKDPRTYDKIRRVIDAPQKAKKDSELKRVKPPKQKLYHGGCHGCTNQHEGNGYLCDYCQYRHCDWSLPDKNNSRL